MLCVSHRGYRMEIDMELGVIFDVDGTLVESMGRWKEAGQIYLEKMGCKNIEPDLYKKMFELSMDDTAIYFKNEYLPDKSLQEIADGINEVMFDFYRDEAEMKLNARKLLDYLYEKDIPMVVATSTDRPLIDVAFERLGLNKYFKKIYTATEFGIGKDKPDIYLDILKTLGWEAKNTWFFEDSLYAIKVAGSLGIKTYGVYDETCKENWDAIKSITDAHSVALLDNPEKIYNILINTSEKNNK